MYAKSCKQQYSTSFVNTSVLQLWSKKYHLAVALQQWSGKLACYCRRKIHFYIISKTAELQFPELRKQ